MDILLYVICGLPLLFVILHTIIRIIRYFYKFPMPQALANAIDHPLRRKLQPEYETAVRHGIVAFWARRVVQPRTVSRLQIASCRKLACPMLRPP